MPTKIVGIFIFLIDCSDLNKLILISLIHTNGKINLGVVKMDIWTIISAIAALASAYFAYCVYHYNVDKERKKQADTISVYMSDMQSVILTNNSTLPIYDVFVIICSNKENLEELPDWGKNYRYIATLMPGKINVAIKNKGHAMGDVKSSANIFFRDSAGVEWFRNNRGILREFTFYKKILGKRKIYAPY